MDLDMLYEDYGGDSVSPEDEDFYSASCDELDTPKYLIVKVCIDSAFSFQHLGLAMGTKLIVLVENLVDVLLAKDVRRGCDS